MLDALACHELRREHDRGSSEGTIAADIGGWAGSTTGIDAPDVTAKFTKYASQPMVVDVELRLPSTGNVSRSRASGIVRRLQRRGWRADAATPGG